MSKVKITFPKFRISVSAVARRLSSVILRARQGELSEEEFLGTIHAVFDSCVYGGTASDPEEVEETPTEVEPSMPARNENEKVNEQVFADEQAEIEKSVCRSEAARRATVRRRQMREERKKQEEAAVAEKVKKSRGRRRCRSQSAIS